MIFWLYELDFLLNDFFLRCSWLNLNICGARRQRWWGLNDQRSSFFGHFWAFIKVEYSYGISLEHQSKELTVKVVIRH